ncbi:MAG: glutamine-hydrolyzing GMP synthase [Alphaproteobacteria bacterium]|nr:glutamine-hydrolyzing GMP synthase [Alphaproteobacteria bacterium]
MKDTILIVDFGSQVTKLIARRIREFGVFSQIVPYHQLKKKNIQVDEVKGIIFSGGPNSVDEKFAPKVPKSIYNLNIPILGICYGLQLICKKFGGKVSYSQKREFGKIFLKVKKKSLLFDNTFKVNKEYQVWMSHSDAVKQLPNGFESIASSNSCQSAVVQNTKEKIYGVQFHPEVVHTYKGKEILMNFVKKICRCKKHWNMKSFKNDIIQSIRKKVGNNNVLCGLSGGVDSTVTAVLVHNAIGDQLKCLFVDTGLMRMNEARSIKKLFNENFNIKLDVVNSSKKFLAKLSKVKDPETKRKIIGKQFIDVFERYSNKQKNIKFLAQGTLYPDVIESSSNMGKKSVTIKSHHNVGGLPKNIKFKLLEPLRELFKDEVRKLGKELNIPNELVNRHPFPGPGLGIRILGEITKKNVEILRKADEIFIKKIKERGLYDKIWQAFCVLLPVKTVGVMGDNRTYERICVLRAVTSVDGMTAESFKFPEKFLESCANEIVNNVKGINRVCYDLTSKPPGTIEYE